MYADFHIFRAMGSLGVMENVAGEEAHVLPIQLSGKDLPSPLSDVAITMHYVYFVPY